MQLLHQREGDVAEQIALMKFIEEDDRGIPEIAIVLQPAEKNALRDEANARSQTGLIVEPNLVADLLPKLDLPFPGDARGDRAGGDAARLKHHDSLRLCGVAGQSGVEQHLRHLGGFPGPGGRDENHAIALAQSFDNGGMNLPDGQRTVHRKIFRR